MQPPVVISQNISQNIIRKAKRAEAATDTRSLDSLAAELRATGATWQAIADTLGYANGAIARRAALRHESRTSSEVESKV